MRKFSKINASNLIGFLSSSSLILPTAPTPSTEKNFSFHKGTYFSEYKRLCPKISSGHNLTSHETWNLNMLKKFCASTLLPFSYYNTTRWSILENYCFSHCKHKMGCQKACSKRFPKLMENTSKGAEVAYR